MLRQSFNAGSIQLRESYIAISNYIRCGHVRAPNRKFLCLRDRAHRAGPSSIHLHPFSTLRSLHNRSEILEGEDITQGFPEPPGSGLTQSTPEGNGLVQASASPQASEPSLPSDPGPDVPVRAVYPRNHESSNPYNTNPSAPPQGVLMGNEGGHVGEGGKPNSRPQYRYMEPFEKATHSWQMLQEIQDATIDDTRYPVVLHGYVTATRTSNRYTDYFNFLDPKLRTMIQVVVTKNRSPPQQSTRPEDTSVSSLASHDAVGAVETSRAQGVSDALPGACPNSSNPGSLSSTVQENENTTEDDTNLSVRLEAGADKSTNQHTPPTTAEQDDEKNTGGEKRGEESVPANSANPICTSYTRIRPHTPIVLRGLVCHRKPRSTRIEVNADRTSNSVLRRVTGKLAAEKYQASVYQDPFVGSVEHIDWLIIKATSITALNEFPPTIIAKNETNFPPEQRHLQLRTKHHLRQNIRARSRAMAQTRMFMFMKGFDEIETPLLFKSTPEGAREFMVPTRVKGMAYALPQSPQQYKQILMASGVSRYFQFARCFRDEDMRADRQPEFTQLDIEMSFATRSEVMFIVERLLTQMLWPSFFNVNPYQGQEKDPKLRDSHIDPKLSGLFPRLTYRQAMDHYGSDKPDLRLASRIWRVERYLPPNLKQMLSPLGDAVFELARIDMKGLEPAVSRSFITKFLDAPAASPYLQNPAGAPGITVLDPEKPLQGLASFGHEAAHTVMDKVGPSVGDILIVQARPNVPHTGSSTPLGNLRRDIYHAAFTDGLLTLPDHDSFLWVVDFPLFSPINDTEPGQGGQAGICSTHHPFTAPKDRKGITLLTKDPLKCIGDHYDLVINGVEVGGGSRRIHDSRLQEFVLRDVLKMKPERVEDFRHLLDALKAGCPPHAGFALGFDRLVAILTRQNSVRDVIAFPKWGDGEDKMVGAPSLMTEDQLQTYHLRVR